MESQKLKSLIKTIPQWFTIVESLSNPEAESRYIILPVRFPWLPKPNYQNTTLCSNERFHC